MKWLIFLSLTIIILLLVVIGVNYSNFSQTSGNLVQTWKTSNIPDNYKVLVNELRNLPGINYMFFTDNSIKLFFENRAPQYLSTFLKLPFKIQQIDFFRYVVIYYYGGLYYDLDMKLIKPFDQFGNKKCIFPIEFLTNGDQLLKKQNTQFLIGNYAFYSPPGHLFLKQIIENIVTPVIQPKDIPEGKQAYIFYTTGPVLVTQTYINYQNKNDIELIKPFPFKPSHFGSYAEHRLMGSWK